jgi:hypothetical protein
LEAAINIPIEKYMATAQPFTMRSERRSERIAPSNRRASAAKPPITIAAPYPLLDEGEYVAECTDSSYAWANRWRKWKARLVLNPTNYTGKAYSGQLCRFFNLGNNLKSPHAGPGSDIRALLVELNGEQPGSPILLDMKIFCGHLYRITVSTVKQKGNGEPIEPANWYSIVRDIHLAK